MNTDRRHSSNAQQLDLLRAKLHRIPEQHPVDRTTGPVVAKMTRLRWLSAAVGIAASVTIVALLWPSQNNVTSNVSSQELIEELYSLGYVDHEDFYDFVEPDSLEFAGGSIDADLFYQYYEDNDNYLLEL
jgi:hypothetical protein